MKLLKPLIFGLLLIALAACSAAPAAPTATLAPEPTSLPPTAVIQPTAAPTQVPTDIPTAAATPTAAPTATPTLPPSEFDGASFFTSGFLPRYLYFITIQAKEPIQGQYVMMVDENKEYECELAAGHADRLMCFGRLAGVDKTIPYVLLEKETHRQVFSGEVIIPLVLP